MKVEACCWRREIKECAVLVQSSFSYGSLIMKNVPPLLPLFAAALYILVLPCHSSVLGQGTKEKNLFCSTSKADKQNEKVG